MEKGLISVDRWGEGSRAYFLTHLHTDHTRGLSSRWCRGTLFCSPVSARLLPSPFPGFDLSLINVIEVGAAYPICLVSKATGSQVPIIVTAIDAHHCPGAVMYLFRGDFGCILHTGYFRWEPTSERAQSGLKMLLDALGGERVVNIIDRHPDHEVIIGVDTIGKEDLLVHISKALNIKIWVWPERLQTMRLLGLEDIFSTKTCLTRVRAVPRYSVTLRTLDELNSVCPTIAIMPTGLPLYATKFSGNGSSSLFLGGCHGTEAISDGTRISPPKEFEGYAYSVRYSEHSSFSEIRSFLSAIQPRNVVGIVSSSFCYIDPRHYFAHLCGTKQSQGVHCGTSFSKESVAVQIGSRKPVLLSHKSFRMKQKWKGKARSLRSTPSGRVQAMRRGQRGAKLVEIDDCFVAQI